MNTPEPVSPAVAVIVREGMPEAPNKRLCERLASLAIVRQALGDDTVVIARSHEGAPRLLGSDLHLSITHDKHIVAVALSRSHGIGIDLQHPRPMLKRVFDRILSEAERPPRFADAVADIPAELALWTAKEAVVKATLQPGVVMTDVTVSADFSSATAFGLTYRLHHFRHADAAVCLALLAPESD